MKPLSDEERRGLFWREVVYQAVRDLLCPELENCSPSDRGKALDWVKSDSDAEGSFLYSCKEAGLNPEDVRGELRGRGIW